MARFEFLKKHIQQGRILDVGNLGQDGAMHKELQKAFPDCVVVGLDNDKEKAKKFNFSNQIIADINEPLPFESEYFNTVYLGQLIEHTWQPKEFLEEVYRALKKNGKVVIDTPHIYSIVRMLRFFLKGKDYLGDPTHKLFFAPAVLANLLEKCGFEIVEILSDRKFSIKSKDIILPNLAPFKWLGNHLCAAAKKP